MKLCWYLKLFFLIVLSFVIYCFCFVEILRVLCWICSPKLYLRLIHCFEGGSWRQTLLRVVLRLRSPAHVKQKWCAVSSMNNQTVSDEWSVLASLDKRCVFLDMFQQISYTFHLTHTQTAPLWWFTKRSCLIFQSRNYAALILNTVRSLLSFVMWLRINAESTVSSKAWDLNVQQKKECIKYINRSIYLRGFVLKIIKTPGGSNNVWTSGGN